MLPEDRADEAELGILLAGTLRKLKVTYIIRNLQLINVCKIFSVSQRMKKKYFILFADRDHIPARLEYFDSEKKWRNGQAPKRYFSLNYIELFSLNYIIMHNIIMVSI